MTENFKDTYSRYYDLLYKHKDYAAEAAYVSRLIRSVNPVAKNILELGCGTGNHAAVLCQDNFEMTGLERSADMVAVARTKSVKGFNPVIADIDNFSLAEKFDAAISLFHVISYLTSNTSLIACFNSVSRHLNNGGVFIFDVWYSPAVYFQKPEARVKELDSADIKVKRLAQPRFLYNQNVVEVDYEIIVTNKITAVEEIFKETHPMRHFSIPEIELLALHSGFKLLKAEEFLNERPPGVDTWGLCFTLQKNSH